MMPIIKLLSDLMGDNGRVTVLNSERLGAGNGSLKVIHGYAEPDGEPGKFSVHLEGVPVGANCTYRTHIFIRYI